MLCKKSSGNALKNFSFVKSTRMRAILGVFIIIVSFFFRESGIHTQLIMEIQTLPYL